MNKLITPLQTTERIDFIDLLRGLAIFGILMVNLPLMYYPVSRLLVGTHFEIGSIAFFGETVIKFFFEGKFYVIFSALFGFGFSIFLNKEKQSEINITPIFLRRLFVLLFFGIFHVVFLWAGDILVFYALFGFLLILFKNKTDKKIIKWAAIFILIPTIILFLLAIMLYLFSLIPQAQEGMNQGFIIQAKTLQEFYQNALTTYSQGSFVEIMNIRLSEYLKLLPGILLFYPVVFGMFLLGFYAGRKNIINDLYVNTKKYKRIFIYSIILGIFFNSIYSYAFWNSNPTTPSTWSFIASAMHTFGGLTFGTSIILSLFFISKNASPNNFILSRINAVGRMALTNYITHSIISVFLFHSYGLGLMGKIHIWEGFALVLVLFIVQMFLSKIWLNYFNYGPLEWIWRSLTYMKVQKFVK